VCLTQFGIDDGAAAFDASLTSACKKAATAAETSFRASS
jgi:hypothetical protein